MESDKKPHDLSNQDLLNHSPSAAPVEGQGKKAWAEKKTRAEAVLDQLQAGINKEIEITTDKKFFKEARKAGFPIAKKILEARDKAARIQESLMEEMIYTSIGLVSKVKQKALSGILEWIENFVEDKEKLLSLNPSQAKTLLSIAFTADQMGRLELGKSTSNVAIAHHSQGTPQQTTMLQQAVERLAEIDPVHDYSKVEVQAINFKPEENDSDKSAVLSIREGSGESDTAVGVQFDSGGPSRDDDRPLPQD